VEADYDVVIVGARVAGASLASILAEAGLRVAVVDRASFPSDTISTHVVYPNTLARLERLGVLNEILAHRPPPLYTAWHHAGQMFVAPHTPEGGRDWALCVRRITLDKILVDRARTAGADVFERFTVHGLLGSGGEHDPVAGVIGRHGDRAAVVRAPLVVGADGVHSTVAKLLRVEKRIVMPTRTAMLYAYWLGLPSRNCQEFFFEPPWIGTHFPADDGYHVVILVAPIDDCPAGRKDEYYRDKVESMRLLGDRLASGEQVGRVIATTRLDGFYRAAAGPGWILTGDAGHFKHPAAVQGIADALEAAEELASLIAAGTQRQTFPTWRDATTREMYAFSRFAGDTPSEEVMSEVMRAAIDDPKIARGIVDIWSRAQRPWDVIPRIPTLHHAAGESADAVLSAIDSGRPATTIQLAPT
jgi:flavin-dependent dehydrogenase